jgi:hypothetical protein
MHMFPVPRLRLSCDQYADNEHSCTDPNRLSRLKKIVHFKRNHIRKGSLGRPKRRREHITRMRFKEMWRDKCGLFFVIDDD